MTRVGDSPLYNPKYPSFLNIESSVANVPLPALFGIGVGEDVVDDDLLIVVDSMGKTHSINPVNTNVPHPAGQGWTFTPRYEVGAI